MSVVMEQGTIVSYSKIQDAINDSSNGDTVFVYDDSSPYYENLIVDKPITLQGEKKETTVINGSDNEIVVNISSDNVILSGFTVQNYGNEQNNNDTRATLIFIQSDYNVIYGNIITGNTWRGIYIFYSEYSTISDNIIIGEGLGHGRGLSLSEGKNNNISGNIIKDWSTGIDFIWYSNNNSIFGNTLTNNSFGITTAMFSINGIISLNNISYNKVLGIVAMNCFNYKITKNNFIGNLLKAQFAYFLIGAYTFGFEYKSLRDIRSTIKWDGNYWNRPRIFPKPIFGQLPPSGSIPWFQFDLHPAQEPYDIEV